MADLPHPPLRPPDPPLQDQRVRLRPLLPADAEAVTTACQDPEIARWVPIPWPYEPEHAHAFIERTLASWEDGSEAAFAMLDPSDGRVVGVISLRLEVSLLGGRRGIVGYWVALPARGRGVATSATRLVARWGLVQLGLRRVSLFTYVGNTPSQRVAQHAGFRFEGTLRNWVDYRGEPRDAVMFSLVPEDLASGR